MAGRLALLCLMVPLVAKPSVISPTGPADAARGVVAGMEMRLPAIRVERWEENAPLGGALEGFHAWIAYEATGALRNRGPGTLPSGLIVMLAGLGVELAEAAAGDAAGVSVQDLAANTAGVIAASTGLTVRYQYSACIVAPQKYRWWARIPLMPVNGHSNAFELGPPEGPAVGLKFRGEPADVCVGFTSMPVLPRESGTGARVAYIGYVSPTGFSAALGVELTPSGKPGSLELGAGFRLESEHVGIVIQALLADAKPGWGLTVYPR